MFLKLPITLIAVYCLLFTWGCGDNFLFEKKLDIPNQSWAWQDTLTFDFEIKDTSKIYSLLLDVSHASDYGFQNLYVQMHTRRPSGKTEKQLLSLELAAQSGVWNGGCGGKWCELEIPLQPRAVFDEIGNWKLEIEQFMRQDPLPGVKSMALKIKEAQK